MTAEMSASEVECLEILLYYGVLVGEGWFLNLQFGRSQQSDTSREGTHS